MPFLDLELQNFRTGWRRTDTTNVPATLASAKRKLSDWKNHWSHTDNFNKCSWWLYFAWIRAFVEPFPVCIGNGLVSPSQKTKRHYYSEYETKSVNLEPQRFIQHRIWSLGKISVVPTVCQKQNFKNILHAESKRILHLRAQLDHISFCTCPLKVLRFHCIFHTFEPQWHLKRKERCGGQSFEFPLFYSLDFGAANLLILKSDKS